MWLGLVVTRPPPYVTNYQYHDSSLVVFIDECPQMQNLAQQEDREDSRWVWQKGTQDRTG